MPLINCKIELNHKSTKNCVLSAAGNDNTNANPGNIIFPIKDTKLYVPAVTLSTRHNQKLLKLLSKGFERSVYWNEHTKKLKIKIRQMNKDIFLESNFVTVNRLFVLVFSNQNADS